MPAFDLDLGITRRRTHPRARQGPRPARLGGRPRDARRLHRHRQARLGHRVRDARTSSASSRCCADKPVVIGGTFFEVVYARGKLDEYKRWLTELGLTHVEISDGTIEIPRDRKLELIADFARDFTVLSEVGSKDAEAIFAPYQWVEWIKSELEAGAWKVITEGREGGTSGIYRPTGEMRTGLVDEIAHEIDVSNLIFEAPSKSSQAWFVKHYGPGVNLGNIPPEEVIPLETLRLGLRGDTLKEVLLGGEPAAAG